LGIIWLQVKIHPPKKRALQHLRAEVRILKFLTRRKILISVNAHAVLFRLIASAHRTKLRVQNRKWKICPQERFHLPRMFLEYTARQAKLPARILIPADNASAIHVRSGKSINLMSWNRIITSVIMAEQPDLLLLKSSSIFI
jgi:hypothetical protein